MSRLRFSRNQPYAKYARLEGTATWTIEALELEVTTSVSVAGAMSSPHRLVIPWSELEKISIPRRFPIVWSRRFVLTARSAGTFAALPGAVGYRFEVRLRSPAREAGKWLNDARLSVADAETARQETRIEESLGQISATGETAQSDPGSKA